MTGQRPTACDIREIQQNGFLLFNPRIIHDWNLKALFQFPRQEDERARNRLVVISLERRAIRGGIVHTLNTIWRTGALHPHHGVGTTNILADIKEHVGKLKLAVVVIQHKLDLVLARNAGFRIRLNIAAAFHAKNLDLDIFLELKLRIVKRYEHHLKPVGASRNHHPTSEILEVRDYAS